MIDASDATTPHLTDMAAKIVGAYVMNNSVNAADLPRLIGDVHSALVGLSASSIEEVTELVPAVSIRKSITPDFLICLDDGKRYPMVAPNYSVVRSGLAKSNGLGRKPAEKAPATSRSARSKG
jgi:predicted transcriptional regulator